ncbi:MAG: flagellar export protein FliJ, partial [Gammaproteobacteria bacterium]|nr:flagellar export protein FliJ [Gammaproteobacteria bacterium]
MRKRSRKISKIVALARSEEQRAGAATGKSRRQLEEQLARLGELNAYRFSYAGRSKSLEKVNSAHWKDYQNFLQRLDQAVASQQQIVKDAEKNLELYRQRWLAKRQRLESLQKVLDRYQVEEAQLAERR